MTLPQLPLQYPVSPYAYHSRKLHALLTSLSHTTKASQESRILIFVLYKKEADRVLETLQYMGYTAGAIHGDLGQAQRMKALEEFKNGKTGLLVATDVAARGLDIPNVGAVINYSFPLTIEGMCFVLCVFG